MGANIDLDLTLYASFSLPMFRKEGDCWTKVYGFGRGARICSDGEPKCYGPPCSGELLTYVAGLWIDRERGLGELEAGARTVAETVLRDFHCLGVSASPWDAFAVLVSAFLSRRTDYHRSTVRWVRAFLARFEALGASEAAAAAAAASVYGEYGSYQLRQLAEVVGELLAAAGSVPRPPDPEGVGSLRRRLLGVKYLGPKVADSFLLHGGLDQSRAPVDVHYLRFLRRHGLLEGGYVDPQKSYCARYECPSCPLARGCVYFRARRLFGGLNGLVQTVAYVMGKLGLRRCEDLGREPTRSRLREALRP